MKILKFGGSSITSADKVKKAIEIIMRSQKANGEMAVVVSAFGGVTDQLIEMAKDAARSKAQYADSYQSLKDRHLKLIKELVPAERQETANQHVIGLTSELNDILHGVYLIKEASLRTLDLVMSFGERLSAFIMAECLKAQDIQAEFLDARELTLTNDDFGQAIVDRQSTYNAIREYFNQHKDIQVITGFLGYTAKKETTTIGRSGSDYTASLFGAALGASEVEIWTDVDGVMTADPHKVPSAFVIERLRYSEVAELSYFGAKVIHPPAVQPAWSNKIPIIIKNTFNPHRPGTIINTEPRQGEYPITGVTSIEQIALLQVQGAGLKGVVGMAMRLFRALAHKNINITLITQASSEYSICIGINPTHAEEAQRVVEEEFASELRLGQIESVSIEHGRSVIAVVGENMRSTPGTAGKIFSALGKNRINVVAIAQGSSELNISIVINKKDEPKALNVIHDAFFFPKRKRINLFLVGTGLIGSELVRQIYDHSSILKQRDEIDVQIVGLANREKMMLNENGIALDNWQEQLKNSDEMMNIDEFIMRMKQLALANTIFVDCTASDTIALKYDEIFSLGFSVVTPNKKANSGDLAYYKRIREVVKQHNVKFFYETNVGAGLPFIRVLNDLKQSGDKILKIEGVLSGTLSYIFNNFVGDKKFSQIIRQAQDKGYTEPDPRDDLNGMDVARKLLILAREIGLTYEIENIDVENLVPESCRNLPSMDSFFLELEKEDPAFEHKKREAEAQNKVLRYIACLENGRAQTSLQAVGQNHPFYALKGNDNIIAFTTQRYNENPLVIKGPGSGPQVSAAGVLADILKV